jgi:hypothetical protein
MLRRTPGTFPETAIAKDDPEFLEIMRALGGDEPDRQRG